MKRYLTEDESRDYAGAQNKRLCSRSQPFNDLSDELILLILSSLSAPDVCVTQLLDRRFANLAMDQMLWQHLYRVQYLQPQKEYHRPGPVRERRSKRSLGLLNDEDRVKRAGIDWKKRYKIRSNWTRGRCKTTRTKSKPVPGREIHGHFLSIVDSNLHVDQEQSGISGVYKLDDIFQVTENTILIVTDAKLFLYDLGQSETLHSRPIAGSKTCKYQDGFLALHDEKNTLAVFHVEDRIKVVVNFKSSIDNDVQLQLRRFEDSLVVGIVYLDCGILDSSLRLQEIVISKSAATVLMTRMAVSACFASTRTCFSPIRRNASLEHGQIVYRHPYLLVPSANRINLYTVHSSPDNLVIRGPQILWGYGSTINSCQVQQALRFVVGSGDAGLKLWDLYSASGKSDVTIEHLACPATAMKQRNHKELFDVSIAQVGSGIISAVSQELVISTCEAGYTTTHDFTI